MAELRITWVKSGIGYAKVQRRTLKALGLHRLNQSVMHNDCASIRGMIDKVKHLVKVEEKLMRQDDGTLIQGVAKKVKPVKMEEGNS